MKSELDRSVLYALEALQPRVLLSADVLDETAPVEVIDDVPAVDVVVADEGEPFVCDLMTTCFLVDDGSVDGDAGDVGDLGDAVTTDAPVRTWFELNPAAGEENPEWSYRTLDAEGGSEVEILSAEGDATDGEVQTFGGPEGELVDPPVVDAVEDVNVIFYAMGGPVGTPVAEEAAVEVTSAAPQTDAVPAPVSADAPAPQAVAPAPVAIAPAAPNGLLVEKHDLLTGSAGVLD